MSKFTRPVYVLCYDGEAAPAAPTAPAATTAPVAPVEPVSPVSPVAPVAPDAADNEKKFSQADLNRIMAEDKRKLKAQNAELEGKYQSLLETQGLTADDRDGLKAKIAELQAAGRTTEQQVEYERKQAEAAHDQALKTAVDRGDRWEGMYKTEKKSKALIDAASVAEAFNPAHIVALLAPNTELKEIEGELVPMVDFPDIDEKTGKPVRTLCTPADAVKRMQQLPQIHGCLFKSNVVAGVGSGQANVSNAGDIDYQTMDAESYRKNREAIKRRLG